MTGVGIFARTIVASEARYYKGSLEMSRISLNRRFENLALFCADVEHEETIYRLITTQFTWAADGGTSAVQAHDLTAMLGALDEEHEFVLCGDFNAPRGTSPIFARIAERYKDNIPENYTTSIDGNLHRAGPLPYMVDGLFTTTGYDAHNVYLQDGVSDHMAIVTDITKR